MVIKTTHARFHHLGRRQNNLHVENHHVFQVLLKHFFLQLHMHFLHLQQNALPLIFVIIAWHTLTNDISFVLLKKKTVQVLLLIEQLIVLSSYFSVGLLVLFDVFFRLNLRFPRLNKLRCILFYIILNKVEFDKLVKVFFPSLLFLTGSDLRIILTSLFRYSLLLLHFVVWIRLRLLFQKILYFSVTFLLTRNISVCNRKFS